jgi:NodT family efflux transporter outer membrane factor (OMF) lipoprotein
MGRRLAPQRKRGKKNMNRSAFSARRAPVLLAALTGLAIAGCAVGPDFTPPGSPQGVDPAHPYTAVPLPAQTASAPVDAGAAQRIALGQDVPALWWEVFHSPALDGLIRSALQHSPTLGAAQAALRQAQALYDAEAGSRNAPAITGQAGVTRQRLSQATANLPGGIDYTLYNASINVSYTFDVFGAAKRELEALQATIDSQRFQVEAAYLSLTANLVTAAIQEASLRAQLHATQAVIDAQERSLAVVERQAALGAVPRQALLAQRTLLAQTRSAVPALEKALAQTRQQLAVYAGRLPGDDGLPEFTLESLQLPQDLPVTLPSTLVRQRPDIQASEALLHAANAQVGVATANLYPQITLSGSAGLIALKPENLFDYASTAWSLGAGVLAPIFNGGALEARRSAAKAAHDQALAQYQQTVLNAFLNVANTLHALDSDARALQIQADAAELARQSLALVERQYRVGAVNVLALLDAQRAVQQTQVGLVQAQAARYADTAALFQALGGGWWNRGELATAGMPLAFQAAASAPSP